MTQCSMILRLAAGLVALAVSTSARGADDEWCRYGYNGALTARTSLRGQICEPRVAWTFATAGREVTVEIARDRGEHSLRLTGSLAVTTAPASGPSAAIALYEPVMQDLDGTGTPRPVMETFHERWAKILPDAKGLQRVAWNHTWMDQKVCRLQLFAYDGGFDQPRLVWQTDPPEDLVFNPLDIIYDLDGDGDLEICVAAHYRVMIFDGATGRKQTELRYHTCRPYGWFGLVDVDADGRMELVTIGDFQSHLDVLTYDPSKPEAERLAVKWHRDIEINIDERRKWPQIGPHPLVDVTGDGRPEIVLNLFNDTGDGEWHAVVLDASTGKSLRDLPRRFIQGSADLDGDSVHELFLTSTDGVLISAFGRIELMRLAGESPVVLRSDEHAAWAAANLPRLGATWSTTATGGMRHVLLAVSPENRRPAFLVMQRSGEPGSPAGVTLTALRMEPDGRCATLWRVDDCPDDLEPLALTARADSGDVTAWVRMRLAFNAAATLHAHEARASAVEVHPLGGITSTPTAARLRPGGPMSVLVEAPGRQVLALEPPTARQTAPRLLWQRPGRGMSDGSLTLGLLASDLDGDGGNEVILADSTPAGAALLVACRADGSQYWQMAFKQTPGQAPVWNIPALTFWWPGHFRQKDRVDLFVNTRRGPMHSDVGQLIDGRTGEVVWRHEKAVLPGVFSWGYAGTPPAVADLDGDGLDELVSLYPVCFWVADGRTGRILHGKDLSGRQQLPAWAAYGEPMIHNFTGQGKPEVLLDSPYIVGVLDTTGAPLWHGRGRPDYPLPGQDDTSDTASIKHALADLDGDGALELAAAGYRDGVRAIDPRDGRKLWALEAPAPTCKRMVAADIDGRAGDELLYPAGDTLVVITGDRSVGRILWKWQGPAALSMPAIADVDGDGQAEIILQAADGTVCCLDAQQ